MKRISDDRGSFSVVFGIFVAILLSYLIVALDNREVNDFLSRLQDWHP